MDLTKEGAQAGMKLVREATRREWEPARRIASEDVNPEVPHPQAQ